ncbi:MAG: triose-phosphate isomerase [Bacteroidetes bacterium]|nr:triose-phosphate isomerase [Bacteroidota bacterium]MBS1628977.1 triose-phosphate isomerase [Bacteroidota bacterium]
MRKKIVAGNWKMNLGLAEGCQLVQDVLAGMPTLSAERQVLFAPSLLHLTQIQALVQGKEFVRVAAQNCHQEKRGAYTGEVSAEMLHSAGIPVVILGHSERREYNAESDAILAQKLDAARGADLDIIFCCGEPLSVRDAGSQNAFVESQIRAALFHLEASAWSRIALAYEPIWAIGTGRTASSAQAQEMHAHIRNVLASQYGTTLAERVPILYGGSCKPSNAAELFACPDVDGGLIGGASLQAADFLGIIQAMVAAK